ncbi:MAG: hypothetical protein QE284_16895 [Rhizobium sp.]|nr:hypothetical protein [Rhizobium sp.]
MANNSVRIQLDTATIYQCSVPSLSDLTPAGRRVPTHRKWLQAAGRLAQYGAEVDRLLDNLQVDISKTKDTLDWRPAVTPREAFATLFAK